MAFMNDSAKVLVIGAGISGLIAAAHLEKAGLKPIVIEASDRAGGRVKTVRVNGFLLDHGFQVLLTAYREAQQYLDMNALDLCEFEPGAILFRNGRRFRIGDPLRNPALFPQMLFSPVGTIKDKLLIAKLTATLKATSEEMLFAEGQPSTRKFLEKYGFSQRIIDQFFVPFFGGIFLERKLNTSAAMFRFVFKKFAEGNAAIPRSGMEEIPRQLATAVKATTFRFGNRVQEVGRDSVSLEDGTTAPFDRLLIATDPAEIVPNLRGQQVMHQTTTNLYFSSDISPIDRPIIALAASPEGIINNWVVLSEVSPDYAPQGSALLSVTLRDSLDSLEPDLIDAVKAELRQMTGLSEWALDFVGRYDIPNALPILDAPAYALQPTQHQLTEHIFLAGDYLLNGSLDAAMRSGRNGALALISSLR